MDTKVGTIIVEADEDLVYSVHFGGRPIDSGKPSSLLAKTVRQLEEYFAGRRRTFDLPLAPAASEFQVKVRRAMAAIPYGETRTYGQMAAAVGKPGGARAVGQAANRNPLPIIIPCHRVVGSGGALGGFAPGVDLKNILLGHEQLR